MNLRHELQVRNVDITLINEKMEFDRHAEPYRPITMEEEPVHTNYLAGLIYPKVGMKGEYIDEDK